MALTVPDVPLVPGVPAVRRSSSAQSPANIVLATTQGLLWGAFSNAGAWGIYDQYGNPLVDNAGLSGFLGTLASALGFSSPLSTSAVEYHKETRLSNFPVEQGSFATYNKVELPANPIVTLCMGGTESDRAALLNAIDAAVKSTDYYTVATPEITYVNYIIERYNYQRRSNRGANLLLVEVSLREVREIATAIYSTVQYPNAQSDTALPAHDNGKVQAQTVAPSQSVLSKMAKGVQTIFGNF